MKVCANILNSNLMNTEEQTRIVNFLKKQIYEIGENISLISYFDNSLDKIKNIFNDNYDLVFFIGTSHPIYNHNIKDNLCRVFLDKLENSQVCYSNLKKYCENHNIPFSMQEELEVKMPTNAIPLVSSNYFNSGFMYKYNNTYIVFFPDNYEFAQENYNSYVLPLIKDITNVDTNYQVIKTFGILEKDIKSLISDIFNDKTIELNIIGDDLDNAIYLRYKKDTNPSVINDCISNIISKLNKFIYSLEDVSIYQMAIELLQVQHKKIAIAETITLGNIFKELSSVDENSIQSCMIFTNFDDIKNNLNIEDETIQNYGKYSVNTIYECTNLLLEKKSADIGLFILGNKSDNTCYMAVGDLDGIHVYKSKINIRNEKTIENLSKTAIFYLIKKLKQNDLQFM